jgi:hypothetical protein
MTIDMYIVKGFSMAQPERGVKVYMIKPLEEERGAPWTEARMG